MKGDSPGDFWVLGSRHQKQVPIISLASAPTGNVKHDDPLQLQARRLAEQKLELKNAKSEIARLRSEVRQQRQSYDALSAKHRELDNLVHSGAGIKAVRKLWRIKDRILPNGSKRRRTYDRITGRQQRGSSTESGMKAIVLSYDKCHPITGHMITSYENKWPSNPFTFRVPYQKNADELRGTFGDKVEMVQTPQDIKGTVLTLLEDLDDHEWIYWCIDDKYLVEIDEVAANEIYEWTRSIAQPSVQGVMFCRCRRLLSAENIRGDSETKAGEHTFLIRKNYYQFWIHQFMRVKVLRDLILSFPDDKFAAKQMDSFTGQNAGENVKAFESDQIMYISKQNFARFGESSFKGEMTKNCEQSMREYGLPVPSDFPILDIESFIGEMAN